MRADIETATLAPQSYGIATAGNRFGGPRGIWLECRAPGCKASDVIVGSAGREWEVVTDIEASRVFRRHGWTGEGHRMTNARCPAHSAEGGS